MLYNLKIMPARIVSDEGKPSAAIEIPLEKPLPDYDLDQIDQPTPRDVDGILVSQGFRDLVDDSRGILMDLLSNEPRTVDSSHGRALNLSHANEHSLQVEQLTGAICPGDDEVYRPGLWIVLRDVHANQKASLPLATRERIAAIANEFVKRLGL
jgi:hypothetical protein